MSESPQDIVARHLSSSLRGYPLWTPGPPRELLIHRPEGLRIGDVGVVVPGVGCFDVCFNICLPSSHPFHQVTRVPDNFAPVELSEEDIRTHISMEPRDKVITGKLSSAQFLGISRQPKDGSTRIKTSGLEYQFSLSSNEGAILILPEGADLVDLRNPDPFREAAMQHGADWYRFAKRKLGQTLAPDSLYLITGLYKTRTWSLAAFDKIEETTVYPASFRSSPTIRRWETTRPLEWGIGPVDNYGSPNQAVFIRGFKIALRSEMFGLRKWIEVVADDPSTERSPVSSCGGVPGSFVNFILGGHSAAWTTQSTGNGMQDEGTTNLVDNGAEHAVNEHVVIQRVPEVSQPFHLSDVVNNYLLNKEPSANIAITHDDDWITMLRENQLQPEELAQNGRLETLISQRQYDITLKQSVVYLHRRSASDSASQAGSRAHRARAVSDSNKHKSADTQPVNGVPGMRVSSSTDNLYSRFSGGKEAATHDSPSSIFLAPSTNVPSVFPDMHTGLAGYKFGSLHPSTRAPSLPLPTVVLGSSNRTRRVPTSDLPTSPPYSQATGRQISSHPSSESFHRSFAGAFPPSSGSVTRSHDGESFSSSSVPISVLRTSSHANTCVSGQLSRDEEVENDYRDDSFLPVALAGGNLPRDAGSERLNSPLGVQGLIRPESEPQSSADGLSIEAQQLAGPSVSEGIDIEYIFSKNYARGSIHSFGSRPSFLQGPSGPCGSSSPSVIGRSPGSSPVTEDTFLSHFQTFDRAFSALRNSWSFQREKVHNAPSLYQNKQVSRRPDNSGKEMPLRMREMWHCARVGRFKVDGVLVNPQSSDPVKDIQQQIHVHHLPDPPLDSISGLQGVIHRHSKDHVFSIFRAHDLFSGHQPGGADYPTTWVHINMRLGIMLAPKTAQEQYTSTQTTRGLNDHGLLDDESDQDSRDKRRKRVREKKDGDKGKTKVSRKGKDKDKNEKKLRSDSIESDTKSTTNSSHRRVVATPKPPSMRTEISSNVSSFMAIYGSEPYSRPGSPSSLLAPSINSVDLQDIYSFSIRYHRDPVDSFNALHPRATHAEAFSTLDPDYIDHLRMTPFNRANAKRLSRLSRLSRLVHPFRSLRSEGLITEPGARAFQPPWMTVSSHEQREKKYRVFNVPRMKRYKPPPLRPTPKRESTSNPSILDHIPDISPYMLLPLWPSRTGTTSQPVDTSGRSFVAIPENRRYLLVHYVPFGDANEATATKDKKPEKKAKHSRSVAEYAKTTPFSVFGVVARVVAYDELRLTGIHLPSDGLVIHNIGPDGTVIDPPAPAPLREAQTTNTVVCQCYGQEQGFEFLEEGLLQLGLCTREDAVPESGEQGETVLTPIGRAAVEMIWFGCLAITSFRST